MRARSRQTRRFLIGTTERTDCSALSDSRTAGYSQQARRSLRS
jgi:hypothetical protein